MTILDANVLLHAFNEQSPDHNHIRQWLEELVDSAEFIALPWVAVWAFIRIATNPRLYHPPMAPRRAFEKMNSLLVRHNVVTLQPGPRHIELLERLVHAAQASGPKVTDAVIAALALEHGATVASTDRDFSRFEGLRWINPLAVR
jgi:toxin-antitoxin system PIN domain toxin